ncbi:MAG: PEP-CTERM sorting domain-containing protein [Microcystaceae cyanobacterium]
MKNNRSNKVIINVASLLTVFSIVGAPTVSRAVQLYGLTFTDNTLVSFESSNPNSITIIGETNIGNQGRGLSFDDSGNLFAFSRNGGSNFFSFYNVNPQTGESTLIGSANYPNIFPGDLAWNPFASRMEVFAFTNSNPQVYEVNLNTGELDLLGTIPGLGNEDGASYVSDIDGNGYYFSDFASEPNRWVQVASDFSSATPLQTVPFDGTFEEQGAAIDWSGDGTFYHATTDLVDGTMNDNDLYQLYTISPETGASTFLGLIGTNFNTNGVQLADIAVKQPIPEPNSLLGLLGLGALGLTTSLYRKLETKN